MRKVCGLLLAFLLAAIFSALPAAQQPASDRFSVDDYFRVQEINELTISPDGQWLAYITQVRSLDQNRPIQKVYVQSLAPGAKAILEQKLSNAHGLAWIPGTRRIAYLATSGTTPQVFSFDTKVGTAQQLTTAKDGVTKFLVSPDGKQLAYITHASKPGSWLYNRFRTDKSGILLNTDEVSSHDFLNPNWGRNFSEGGVLWLTPLGQPEAHASIPGDVNDVFWSSDSRLLSVAYVASDNPPSLMRAFQTSVGILDAKTKSFRPLAKSYAANGNQPGKYFDRGDWVPGSQKIMLLRVTERDPWTSDSFPDWGIVDTSGAFNEGEISWYPAETYDQSTMGFFPVDPSRVLVENNVNGVRGLFAWTAQGIAAADAAKGVDGSTGKITFSEDFRRVAFVNESLSRPPEIYVRLGESEAPRQLTQLNVALAKKLSLKSSEVTWTSTDGVTARGWLIVPNDPSHQGPWPMVTMVHGGPAFVILNKFAPYFFTWGGVWPYPFEAYTSHGIAVFYPNYRGTHSFGKEFASPAAADGTPVDDIVTGVQHLVETGVADPQRLGISGHSHGGWLGPLTLTRAKIFRASSFAEGTSNMVTVYELMPGHLNKEVHDTQNGPYYENPQRYLDLSPDLHFQGVSTANLFESGSESEAIFMLGLGKTSRRFGMPTEMIVYPHTEHNLQEPRMERESAERNLDWYRFWLKDEVDPNPAKGEQYKRWKKMAEDWDKARAVSNMDSMK
jgi:dipeptidyl aminopeptidase/acylaminoacyl peptidase